MSLTLKPSEISSHKFKNGRQIGQVLDDICEGRISVSSFPLISVMKRDGRWTTSDNRRLWVFRELERLGKLDEIAVVQVYSIHDKKLTTINGGVSVKVRGTGPGGIWHNRLASTASLSTYLRSWRDMFDSSDSLDSI
ncbi:hypothetical protein MAR_024907 [Mya arenaria]|uniref:Uncharacterized protein n=1 Tax=Mya arenaria TaxID=6604 RepID=A0ABY7DV64_MYAAR|nr:hypothetical protein MAR_024907 [Mya arenaria]